MTSRTANLVDFRERSRTFQGLTGFDAFFGESAYTLRSFRAVLDVDFGFDPSNTVAWQLSPDCDNFATYPEKSAFYALGSVALVLLVVAAAAGAVPAARAARSGGMRALTGQ